MSGADRQTRARPRVAVVTGASAGLGRALSVALARRGLIVAGIAQRPEALEETGRLCPQGQFAAVVGDVSDPARMRQAFAAIERDIGEIAILFNNAAIYPRGDLLEGGLDGALAAVGVNLTGAMICAAEALGHMVPRGRGRIVNVGSFAGEAPLPGSLGYSVSKAGLRAFSRALAVETQDRLPGIVVSEWIPGVLATGMGRPDGLDPAQVAEWGAALALDRSPGLHAKTFVGDTEHLPPRSNRERVKDLLRGGRPAPRRLTPLPEASP